MIDDILKVGTAIPLNVQFKSRLKDGFYCYEATDIKDLIRVKPNSAIYLDSISFSASCKTWDFASAATDGIGVQFATRGSREPILLRQIKFYAFSDFMSLNAIAQSKKPINLNDNNNRQDDYLTLGINGRIKQTEALIKENKTTVNILISIAAYEIKDMDLINAMTMNKHDVYGQPPQAFNPNRPPVPPQYQPINTTDAPPPNSFHRVNTISKGAAQIHAWRV